MERRESLREVENLRFRFQMNNRLRLECLAAVSKVFREFGEPIKDELLSSIVFALPQELVSNGGGGFAAAERMEALPPERPQNLPPVRPGLPPQNVPRPGTPDELPGRQLPPENPSRPGSPPEQVASEYVT